MERNPCTSGDDEPINLPPGFRFHPTDEELITHYLSPKVLDTRFRALAMGEVDLNKCEPWDLPRRAKMGEKEWYFFCTKDRKYPTGLRTNRATASGYWKATGKDKEIYRMKTLVGMKKTLVFYGGRAPKGEKTDWVMHEYRLEGRFSALNLSKPAKKEWVICRVFRKSAGGKKIHISDLSRMDSELNPSVLPPLTDSSPYNNSATEETRHHHVTCFSESTNHSHGHPQEDAIDDSSNNVSAADQLLPSNSSESYPTSQSQNYLENQDTALLHDQSLVRMLLENYGSTSAGAMDLDFLWKY
ncbi:NAC domain-containing protein 100-like [Punica granatum]|uniref:NAC domain-containing protein 100-like n=1 Tax=Punica granatum TaxID=22663 RepID=A0A218WPM8_PUNGR|nr:NAC domain-containing protein 100-like [Punica granatum]OWM74765.1 hypothetical protein CDL15_Pgr004532 [Punica granatum]